MRNLKITVSLVLTVLIFNNCATFFLPGKQKVTIQTSSEDAKIYVDNEKFGEGLSVTNKVKKGKAHEVAIVYGDGFVQENYVLLPSAKRSTGYYICQGVNAGCVMAAGLGLWGLYSDYYLAKAFSFPKVVSFKDEPRLIPSRDENSKYVYLSNIGLELKDVEDQLYWNSGVIRKDLYMAIEESEEKTEEERVKQRKLEERRSKGKNKELLVDEEKDIKFKDVIFTEDLQRSLYEGGFMDTINDVFMDYNNSLFLEGKISDIDLFRIAPNKNVRSGRVYTARTRLTWYIKNSYGEVVDSITDVAFSENFSSDEDIVKKIVGSSVTELFYQLLEDSTFKNNSKLVNDFDPKLELTTLNKPDSIVMDKRDAAEASVIIKTESGHGSGFAVTNDGYIITNYHVLVDRDKGSINENIIVIDFDGNELQGTVVKVNKYKDVALLKVNKDFKKAFYCTSTKSFRKMDDVYTIGAPKSISLGQSISSGLISNEREVNNNSLIQLSMAVNSGNSGGPIFSDNGNLHGVVVSKLVGKGTEGVSFAIPSYKLLDYLKLEY